MPALVTPSTSSVASLTSGSSFSSYSSNSTLSNTSMDRQPSDLMDQLKNSPETRFHAAWLFLRFFYLTMSPERNSGPRDNARNLSRQSSLNSNTSASTNQEGRDLIIWDIAIACLALSVKVTLICVFGAMFVAN
jgi:D-alanyl-lipoteichoic acid acyltransferase DltB (MBOAT superfamily)